MKLILCDFPRHTLPYDEVTPHSVYFIASEHMLTSNNEPAEHDSHQLTGLLRLVGNTRTLQAKSRLMRLPHISHTKHADHRKLLRCLMNPEIRYLHNG